VALESRMDAVSAVRTPKINGDGTGAYWPMPNPGGSHGASGSSTNWWRWVLSQSVAPWCPLVPMRKRWSSASARSKGWWLVPPAVEACISITNPNSQRKRLRIAQPCVTHSVSSCSAIAVTTTRRHDFDTTRGGYQLLPTKRPEKPPGSRFDKTGSLKVFDCDW